MAQHSVRACRIEQVGKQRNGRPRYWCSAHKASATGPHGIRLEHCELAYRAVEPRDVFDLEIRDWPGGVALWGAVEAVYDTTARPPDVGIHVHARRVVNSDKEIDRTFDAVRVRNQRNLLDDPHIIISSETAVNYYLSKFMDREIRHLYCIRCGEPHLDAGYFAIHPHRRHLCHGCGHIFHDTAKFVSNPIALLQERADIPHVQHEPVIAPDKLNVRQSNYPGGIQIWASNPAFVWTSPKREEKGLHVHAYGADGGELINGTYSEVVLDGVTLSEKHIRYYMAQNAIASLRGRIKSLDCSHCGMSHFSSGEEAFKLRSEHHCGNCGRIFRTPGRPKMVVTNPFVEVREKLLEGKSVGLRSTV